MFQFTDDLRGNLFIQMPGFYFEYKLWRELPLASKAILPVIYKHMNAWGGCYPSQQTIAILAGITEKTAREGLKGLDGLHGFCKKKYATRRGRTSYKYTAEDIFDNQETISISHAFFNGGNWSQLTPSAKAVYPVLKYFKWWDFTIYREDEEISVHEGEDLPGQNYPDRKYDYAYPECEHVAEHAGVNVRSLHSAYESLSEHHFIKFHGEIEGLETWRLFTDPPKVYEPEYLNDQIAKRYVVEENFTY